MLKNVSGFFYVIRMISVSEYDMLSVSLVVGLGNPGSEYEGTRHNIGFEIVDALLHSSGIRVAGQKKFSSEFFMLPPSAFSPQVGASDTPLVLLKPMTYMNLSGKALQSCLQFYKIAISSVLVIHDDIDLSPGVVKIKQGGGAGGHNGLKDIDLKLGDRMYWRIRVGVGHPGHRDRVANWVLSHPPRSEQALLDEAKSRVVQAFPSILAGNIEQARKQLQIPSEGKKD